MIQMLEPMLSEIREEAVTTKRVLERVPADKLSWASSCSNTSTSPGGYDVSRLFQAGSSLCQYLSPQRILFFSALCRLRAYFCRDEGSISQRPESVDAGEGREGNWRKPNSGSRYADDV